MKKIICVLLALIMLGAMVGCSGNKRFDSEIAMMEHLDGMWVVDSAYKDKTYYIFKDGKVFSFNDAEFSYRIEDYFDSFVSGDNLFALSKLDYEATIGGMGIEKIIGNAEENVVIQPSKGKIIIDQGRTYEKNIIVTDETVFVKRVNEDKGTPLTKLSDVVNFTGEHFTELFEKTKKNYTISTTQFWTDTKEYGTMVKAYNPEVDGWELTTNTEDSTIYESSKWVPSISGALIITDTSVTFTRKVALLSNWNSNIDWNPTFTVHYTPNEGKIMIIDQDNLSLDLPLLIQYGANAVKNFPGAYDDYMKLYNVLASEQGTVKNGTMTVEKTINGLTYKIQMGTNGTWAIVTITANSTILLSSIAECIVNVESVRTCPQCNKTEPNVVFMEDWKARDICFGCSRDNFHGGEEGKKYCSQCGADCTYRGLEEDGRCEDCYFADSNSPNSSGGSSGNTSNGGNTSQQPTSCSHNYTDATCIKPQTCSKCGATSGTALGHTYSNATCTTPQTCTKCGNTTGTAKGHSWQGATCTHPETCSVCNHTQGDALGHNMGLTKCSRCDYTDYSAIAKLHSKVTAYDSKTGEDLEVTNVSVSDSGVLCFTFNGNSYSITIKERVYDSMTYFDCYQNGSKLSKAECRIGDASYYNMLHFEWDGIDGHRLYFCTEKQ